MVLISLKVILIFDLGTFNFSLIIFIHRICIGPQARVVINMRGLTFRHLAVM